MAGGFAYWKGLRDLRIEVPIEVPIQDMRDLTPVPYESVFLSAVCKYSVSC
jgi:hypothetical protein